MKLAEDLEVAGLKVPDENLFRPVQVPENLPVDPAEFPPPLALADFLGDGEDESTTGEPEKDIDSDTKEKRYGVVCDICSFVFQSKKHLARHKRIHMGIKVLCNLCGKSFSRNDALRVHKMTKHHGTDAES